MSIKPSLSTLIQLSGVSLNFTTKRILKEVNFSLQERQVIGIVGRNGSGKSSFLKLLAGINEPDEGKIIFKSNIKIFYIAQDVQSLSTMSGGQDKKFQIDHAVSQNPDVLILDEPTNHLDIRAIEDLEMAIKQYHGSVVVVSHDRYFLDNVTSQLLEIYNGKIYSHLGNYKNYLQNKSLRLEIEATEEARRQAFIKKELLWVNAGVQARSTKDKGRLDRFKQIKNQQSIVKEETLKPLLPKPSPLSNKIINLEGISVSREGFKIVENLTFTFQPRTRLGIVGPNGSGKTTLIKTILGELSPLSGKVVVGYNTIFNYQDQAKLILDLDKTPMQEIADEQEKTSFGSETIATRKYLKSFLFDSKQLLSKISNLSGGERARLLLAKILKVGGNCIVLDEPTNDLDLETIQVLEDLLINFDGVAIIASHDRYFLNRVCNQIMSLEGDGNYILSTGNFDQMLKKKALRVDLTPLENNTISQNDDFPKAQRLEAKLSSKQLRIRQKRIRELENTISVTEKDLQDLEKTFTTSEFYSKKPEKISKQIKKHEELKSKLTKLMQEWENLITIS